METAQAPCVLIGKLVATRIPVVVAAAGALRPGLGRVAVVDGMPHPP